jgi:hypothetical protein
MGDVVYNHFGPNDMDLWQYDGWSIGNGGGIFFFQDAVRAQTPWGPRPDFGRNEVRSYIRDNAMMWLDEFRMDGLRFDGTKYIRKADQQGPDIPEGWSLLQWVNNEIDAVHPRQAHHRGGPRHQRVAHEDHRRRRRGLRLAVGSCVRAPHTCGTRGIERLRARHGAGALRSHQLVQRVDAAARYLHREP